MKIIIRESAEDDLGEAVPGDPQHSFNNIVRAGFSPAYLRANYEPVR